MKEYSILWHPTSHILLLEEMNMYAQQGWRLFSYHDSNRQENFSAVMERDLPNPPMKLIEAARNIVDMWRCRNHTPIGDMQNAFIDLQNALICEEASIP